MYFSTKLTRISLLLKVKNHSTTLTSISKSYIRYSIQSSSWINVTDSDSLARLPDPYYEILPHRNWIKRLCSLTKRLPSAHTFSTNNSQAAPSPTSSLKRRMKNFNHPKSTTVHFAQSQRQRIPANICFNRPYGTYTPREHAFFPNNSTARRLAILINTLWASGQSERHRDANRCVYIDPCALCRRQLPRLTERRWQPRACYKLLALSLGGIARLVRVYNKDPLHAPRGASVIEAARRTV